jgi:hypothetical protein
MSDVQAQIHALSTALARERRLNRAALVLIASVGLLVAAKPDGTVRAEKFELVDATGEVRGSWSSRSGGSELQLVDDGGNHVILGTWADAGPRLAMYDPSGMRAGPRVFVAAGAERTTLQLADATSIPRIRLDVRAAAQHVEVIDPSGLVRADLGGSDIGEQALFLGDRDGGPSLAMGATTTGTSVDLGD